MISAADKRVPFDRFSQVLDGVVEAVFQNRHRFLEPAGFQTVIHKLIFPFAGVFRADHIEDTFERHGYFVFCLYGRQS